MIHIDFDNVKIVCSQFGAVAGARPLRVAGRAAAAAPRGAARGHDFVTFYTFYSLPTCSLHD